MKRRRAAEPDAAPPGEEAIDLDAAELPVVDDEEEAGAALEGEEAASLALVPLKERPLPSAIDPLARYLQQVRRYPVLDPETERELARRYRETGDPELAARLITSNLQLVVKLALMYRRALRSVMDLIQEGNIGLLEALKRYDPEQGVRFSTYASWWIKAYILKYLLDNARLVRVGTTNARRKLLYNLRKEQRKLEAQGVVPTTKLLADRFGVSEQDVVDVDRALSSHDVSVDAPVGDDTRASVGDLLPADGPSAFDEVATAEIRERLDRAIAEFRSGLDRRERAILDRRLVADEPATLQALGDEFGVTREAMRQAEAKLKRRLAAFLRQRLGDEIRLQFL